MLATWLTYKQHQRRCRVPWLEIHTKRWQKEGRPGCERREFTQALVELTSYMLSLLGGGA